MNTIEVMRRALEALEHPQAGLVPHQGEWRSRTSLAIDALRAELERLDAVEPVAWVVMNGVRRVALHLTSADASADRDRRQLSNDLSGNLTAHWVAPLYTAPIAPSIPALTVEDVAASAPEFADVPKYGPAYLAGAYWAYTLAAARTGARIVKADTLQELADDARQIGLEY